VSRVYFEHGLLTDNTMVLAEGQMNAHGVFVLYSLIPPPCEPREATIARFPALDLVASQWARDRVDRRMRQLESELAATDDSHMIVVLSDVRFDDAACMAKLQRLFEGFANMVPQMFVLMGTFFTRPPDAGSLIAPPVTSAAFEKAMQQPFDAFADLVAQFPALATDSCWVFLPGAGDPGAGDALPRRGISSLLTKKLRVSWA
jgi:DNA polymerase epsilon subunit 2